MSTNPFDAIRALLELAESADALVPQGSFHKTVVAARAAVDRLERKAQQVDPRVELQHRYLLRVAKAVARRDGRRAAFEECIQVCEDKRVQYKGDCLCEAEDAADWIAMALRARLEEKV